MLLTYVLDATNRIVEIDGPWDRFASDNGAPDLTAERVKGHELAEFVSGPEMQALTAMLLARAREAPLGPMDFRCDSAWEKRWLTLRILPLAEGRLRCESRVVRVEARPERPLFDPTRHHTGDLVIACSWCRKVRIGPDRWVEVDEAVEYLGLFLSDELPQLSHGICPGCRVVLRGARA